MEEKIQTLTDLQALTRPEYLGPCDAFSIPVRNGCQALTIVEATPVGEMVAGMRRESLPPRRLYRRHCAVWVN